MTDAPDNHWMLKAECRGKWDLFDSVEDDNGKDVYPYLVQARATCSVCPVWDECHAAGAPEVTNIWAGEIKGGKK